MSIFATLGQLADDGIGSTTKDTPSVSPTTGRTIVLYVANLNGSGAANPPTPATPTGLGATWALADPAANWIEGPGGAGFGEVRMTAWIGTGATGPGVIHLSSPGFSCQWAALVGETDAGSTVRQVKLGNTSPGTGTSVSATTDVATLGGSFMLGLWINYDLNTSTPNWTNGYNVTDSSLATWGISYHDGGSDTGSFSSSSSQLSILVVELTSGGGGPSPMFDDDVGPPQVRWAAKYSTPRGSQVERDAQGVQLKNFPREFELPWPPPWLRPWKPAPPPVRPVLFDVPEVLPTGAFLVASGQLEQNWAVGSWESPGTVSVSCAAGDTILVLFAGWFPGHNSTPTDSAGTLVSVVDQGTAYAGTDHVYGQAFIEENASAGAHVITPPTLGGTGDDGTLYVLVYRGLKLSSSVRFTGEQHARNDSTPITGNTVALSSACQAGDLVVALSLEDNTVQTFTGAGFSDPPSGWISAGAQQDAALNVPSEVCYRIAPTGDTSSVAWTWTDPNVNLTSAIIVALKPLGSVDGVTGTLDATVPAPTLAASAQVAVSAALAGTVPAPSLAGTAAAAVAAALGASVPAPGLAADAGAAVSGALGATAPDPSASMDAAVGAAGQFGASVPAPALAADATVGVSATLAAAVPGPVLAASALVAVAAMGALGVPAPALAASAAVAVSAALAAQVPAPALDAAGSIEVSNALVGTVPAPTLQAAATVAVSAVGGLDVPVPNLAAVAAVGVSGQLAVVVPAPVLDADAIVTAAPPAVGEIAVVVPAPTFAAVAAVHTPGVPETDYRATLTDPGPRYTTVLADAGPRYRVTLKEDV